MPKAAEYYRLHACEPFGFNQRLPAPGTRIRAFRSACRSRLNGRRSAPEVTVTERGSVLTVASLMVMWAGLTFGSPPAAAQNSGVEAGGRVSVLRLSEFENTGVGVGTFLIWPLTSVVAIDGAFTWFPGARDVNGNAFESQHRTLGLVGVRASVRYGDVELFGRGRVGFLSFVEQDSAVCIAIVPTPLDCRLARGYTALASDLGGGASIGLGRSGRLRLHIDAGNLVVRYALEAFRPSGEITDGLVSHNLLVGIGLGWRF